MYESNGLDLDAELDGVPRFLCTELVAVSIGVAVSGSVWVGSVLAVMEMLSPSKGCITSTTARNAIFSRIPP